MPQFSNKYDLEERTAKFGETIITFCKTLTLDAISTPIISQLICSRTSVGANYMEANAACSKRDFAESKHWLRMLATSIPERKEDIRKFWRECQQLTLIFQKITNSLKEKKL